MRTAGWSAAACCGALVLGALGCSSSDTQGGDDGGGAQPPDVDPPASCLVGEIAMADGTCLPPGLIADECATGFVGDEVGGCVPVLPAEPCEEATTALPGDATCRPIADCGEGPWGAIEVGSDTVYVDAAAAGGDGSAGAPFATISEAVAAATTGAIVAVAAGSYNEEVALGDKAVTLWARCPSMVSLTSSGTRVTITPGAPVTVRGFGMSGFGAGIHVAGGEATLADLWLHDLSNIGIFVDGNNGPAHANLEDVHIARVVDVGVLVVAAMVDAVDVVTRDVALAPNGKFGRGWDVEAGGNTASSMTLSGGVVDRVFEHGIYLSGAFASIDRLVVRDVAYNDDADPGRGISVRMNSGGIRSSLALSDALIERAVAGGVHLAGSDGTVERVVVRDVAPRPDGHLGHGLSATDSQSGANPDLVVRRALVERCHGIGVLTTGGRLVVDGLWVRDMIPDLANGFFGRGVGAQPTSLTIPVEVDLRNSWVHRSVDAGVGLFGATATIDSVAVDTVVAAGDGSFGDGIDLFGGIVTTSVTISGCEVRGAARAGIANFVSGVSLVDTRVACNGIDLNAEASSTGEQYVFSDQGGNVCGCDVEEPCKVFTTGLTPPGTPDPLEP
jgi:hypothetical protein